MEYTKRSLQAATPVLLTILMMLMIDTMNCSSENIAFQRPAWQVSTVHDGVATRANDGDRNSYYPEGTCTHTDFALNPWWYTDLGFQATIGYVIIVNRIDANTEELHDFNIGVMVNQPSDDISLSDYAICATHWGTLEPGEVARINCTQVGSELATAIFSQI